MSKIQKAFENGPAFIGFLTGGDPNLEKSEEYILALAESGADLIEIGIPFSDPIAEGPTIQNADMRALAAGATTDKLFEMVARIRQRTQIPICFMTYLSPVFTYGYARFFSRCREVGIDGVIIPDLPYEEKAEAADAAKPYGVDIISLIAPTSEARIRTIASQAEGFLYVVSSMGVTGVRSEITTDIGAMMELVRQASDIPAAIGFGISTPEQAAKMAALADGVIVGSALVRLVERYGEDAAPHIRRYVREMKEAIRQG